mmetsp:Transcript_38593/g.38118  ORF Transcript_38593/g.38118 Transcript_38593/m.38118 type:complete len:524 (-) Transcript_38593:35-1606(-)
MHDENGPIKFRLNDGELELYSDIENSFTDIANVIYIDQPYGVGYSYSDSDVTNGKQVGQVMLTFMQKFYEIYPEQKKLDLIIAGNSYAGHFMPSAVNEILDFNKDASADDKIPMYGLLVEDGYVDPITQRLSIKQLALGTGLLTLDLVKEYEALENKCEQSIFLDPENAFSKCKAMNSLLSDTDGNWEIMDVRDKAGAFSVLNLVDDYFEDETVQKQMNVGDSGNISFSHFNGTVYNNMKFDGLVDDVPLYERIVDSGVKTIVFSGTFDGLDGVYGTQLWVQELGITKNFDQASQKSVYHYPKAGENDIQIGGTYKTFERNVSGITQKLSYVTVYNAGHVLGITQFPVSKSLLSDMISEGKARCHKEDNNCETEGNVCMRMNHCNNAGQCVNSRCKCNDGIYGADCSINPTPLRYESLLKHGNYKNISLFPREWTYFSIPALAPSLLLEFQSQNAQEIYIYQNEGSAPTRSEFSAFKKGVEFTFAIDSSDSEIILAVHNPSKSKMTSLLFSTRPASQSTATSR